MSILPRDLPGADGSPWQHAAGPIPWDRFRAEVLALYEPPLRARATYTSMRHMLDVVSGLVGPEATTSTLSPSLIARLIATRPHGQSAYTTASLLSYLRAACGYAYSQQYIFANPFAFRKKWIRTPAPADRQRHHSLEDIARVIDLAREDVSRKLPGSWSQWRARRLLALVSVVAYTGLRRNEALHLRTEDIDLHGRMLLILPRAGSRLKTEGSAQPVPIPDALGHVLAEWIPHLALPEGHPDDPEVFTPRDNPSGRRDTGWLFPNAYRTGPWVGGSQGHKPLDQFKRLGKRAGVEGFTFLSLRHSWATHAESKWGFSEAFIQRVLRHTNRRTQRHYRHADPENLKAAVGGFPNSVRPRLPQPVLDTRVMTTGA